MATHHTNDGAIHLSSDYGPRTNPLTGFPEPPPWMADANCAGTDPEAFFPEKGGSTREAKGICSRCSVQAECLDWALDADDRFGIWGGLSERERRRLKPPTAGPGGGLHRYGHLQARIRAWAREQGLPAPDVGSMSAALIRSYIDAHPEHDQHLDAIHDSNTTPIGEPA